MQRNELVGEGLVCGLRRGMVGGEGGEAYATPVVSRGVCENIACWVDGGRRNRHIEWVTSFQLRASILVPEAIPPITTHCCKCHVLWMEADCMHRVHVLVAISWVTTMTFKREVVLRLRWLQVLDAHTALDAPHRETCTGGKGLGEAHRERVEGLGGSRVLRMLQRGGEQRAAKPAMGRCRANKTLLKQHSPVTSLAVRAGSWDDKQGTRKMSKWHK